MNNLEYWQNATLDKYYEYFQQMPSGADELYSTVMMILYDDDVSSLKRLYNTYEKIV